MFNICKKKYLFTLLFNVIIIPLIYGQLRFEHFTIEDGLSNNSIRLIIQDEKGFLWFGTLNGLNRFDGKNIRTFSFEPGNLTSLSSNRINNIYEDSYNFLWIFTFENHILRFDPGTEKFENINYLTTNHFQSFSNSIIFHESSPGIIWIAPYRNCLFKITENKDNDKFKIDIFNTLEILQDNQVNFIHSDKNKILWFGTEKGLFSLNNDTLDIDNNNIVTYNSENSVVSFTNFHETDASILFGTVSNGIYSYQYSNGEFNPWGIRTMINTPISEIYKGIENGIIVTTDDQGFYYFPRSENQFHHFSYNTVHNDKLNNSYFEIFQDKTGIYWLISPKRGITMFKPDDLQITYFGLNPDYRESPGDLDKQTILEDSNGDLWIGLYGGGLCRFDRKNEKFDHFYYSSKNPYGLSSNFILSLFEDRSRNLWIGTFQGGLNKLELVKYDFKFVEPVKNARFKSENEVRSLLEDRFKRLWVGTKDGHIFCFNDNREIVYSIPEDLKTFNNNYIKSNVYAMLEDDNGNLWIGTKGNGLIYIKDILATKDLKSNIYKINQYMPDNDNPNSISYNDIFALHKDHLGQIWVGTYHQGIDIIEKPNEVITFKNYKHVPTDRTSLSDNRIRCFFQDNQNNLWIGTSHGLNFLSNKYIKTQKKVFINYYNNPSDKNSLSHNDILFIHQDVYGKIWTATYGGGLNVLIKDPVTREQNFQHFFRKDGLPSDVVFSILEDDKGNLWLGTDNGLCKFSNNGKEIERYVAKEGLSDNFYSEGTCIKSVNGDFIFGQKSGFVQFNPDNIKRDTKQFPLVITGFNLFDQRMIAGQKNSPLKKSIETTNEITLKYNQNFISIEFAVTDFKSPEKIHYAFVLENFEEKWNYVINQNKAVYRGLSPGRYVFKVKSTNSNGIWLDNLKELKINILPPIWKTKWAIITYILSFIILSFLIIHFILKELKIRNEIKYEKRLTEDKLMFYTNISHEFKTPLTLINNSTDDLLESLSISDDNWKKVTLIKKNSNRLLNLIDQLLDFRKIQKGKMELKTRKIEIISFLNDIYLTFLPLAEKKKIEFLFNINKQGHEGWIDPKHLEKIVINLLSNAFKHTPEKKRILFDIEVNDSKEIIIIKVIDHGEGIKKENLQNIFDRFAFIDKDLYNQFKGTGIGLSLSRDLVILHKGNIYVESELQKGSTFTVELPIGYDNYNDNEKDKSDVYDKPYQVIPFHTELIDINDEEFTNITQNKSSSAIKSQILIIEDNDELRNYLVEKLKKNFIVNTAIDGEQGIQKATENNPDLILSDVKMPNVDGLELVRQLKNDFNTSHIPIILLTAKSSLEYKMEGLDIGADDYITKPFNMQYLQKRILNIIKQRKILKEKFSQEPGFKPEKLTVSVHDQKLLTKVIKLVEENLKTPNYSIENIIEELGYSRTVFYKKMKGISGYAPKEFIRIVKMKKAASLLREPDATISQVSYDVGYNDPDYFSKSFKNYFGEPPSKYQKKYR